MVTNKVIVVGGKESFFIRVLVKKIQDSGLEASFVPADIDEINNSWDATTLLTYYMETGEALDEDIKMYLLDKLRDGDNHMILIGDPADTKHVTDMIPLGLIYRVFPRPLDNDAYISAVMEFFDKKALGEFKKSILIVDDDPSYVGLVRGWLKDTYKVAMAASGLQAIKWLGKNKVDLILLDYEMPVTNGPQVLEMLRNDEETKDIPVMFLTGKSDKTSVMDVVGLKPEGYLLKTITREHLVAKVDEFFLMRS